jgi:hypothetical protein
MSAIVSKVCIPENYFPEKAASRLVASKQLASPRLHFPRFPKSWLISRAAFAWPTSIMGTRHAPALPHAAGETSFPGG